MEGAKVAAPGVKKAKKKQVKDELDRIKQAEKKKRRLEKALATSAAIISELEKKKQKKKEEQERLDLEGAAIAEAVALHVLHGEDSDDSMKKNEGLTSWDRASNMGFNILGLTPLPIPYQEPPKYLSSRNTTRWASDARRYELMQSHCGNSSAIAPPARLVGDFYPQHFGIGPLGLSADHLAAQAISSLKIADDARVDAYAFNRVLRG